MSERSAADPKNTTLIGEMGADRSLVDTATLFMEHSGRYKYTYNFTWLGLPIIQFPQDLVAFQEIIWRTRPTLIIETGIAHGGSLIFSASMLALCGGKGEVVGVDIDIRQHNRIEIERHPLAGRITMFEGSSIDRQIVDQITAIARRHERVMLILDSNHTHAHVLAELHAYAPLVSPECYLIVCDTVIADMPEGLYPNRPWTRDDNPLTAVHEFLKSTDEFEIDKEYAEKLLITVAAGGYLRRVKPEK